jgi:hypothetical protein
VGLFSGGLTAKVDVSKMASFGLARKQVEKGYGYNAVLPAVMLKKSFPLFNSSQRDWMDWLMQLARRNARGTKFHKQQGAIAFSYSASGASFIAHGAKYNSFASTVGYSTGSYKLFNLYSFVGEGFDSIKNQLLMMKSELPSRQ